jgi:Aspartyl protease
MTSRTFLAVSSVLALSAVSQLSDLSTVSAVVRQVPNAPQPPRRMPPPPATVGDRADIDIDVGEGMPTALLQVNGRGPYRFGIDTGAQGYARVSARLADALGLTPVGEVMTADPSGINARTMPIYGLDKVDFGGLSFTDVTAEHLQLADAVDGILAIGLFRDLLLTLDYGRSRLVARPGALPNADGATVLSYTPGPGGSVQVPIRIGDLETVLNLDTGAARVGMALPPEKLKQVSTHGHPRAIGRVKTISQEFEVSSIELAAPVKFGALTLPITSATFPSPDRIGVIGSAALRTLAVTIDQRNRRVRIVPSER